MKKKIPLLLMCIFCFMHLVAQDSVSAFEYTDCFLEDCPPDDTRIQYAYLTVPEDYSQPEGRKLRLAVVIIKAQNGDPLPDPVMHLRGGPGGKALLNGLIRLFQSHPIGKNRDIILMDFRGIGLSEPEFCPDLLREILKSEALNISVEEWAEMAVSQLEDCFKSLIHEGIDLNMYNSAMVIKDLEMLRKAMGPKTWNLWGISYGTRLAQTYMRDYPQSVRCAILDSPYPVGYPAVGEEVRLYRNALTSFFNACSSDPECSKVFPDLESRFYHLMSLIKDEPIVVKSEKATDGLFILNFHEVHDRFQSLLYNPENYPILPLIISEFEKKNFGFIENSVKLEGSDYILSIAMFITIMKYDNGLIISDYDPGADDPLHNSISLTNLTLQIFERMGFIKPDSLEILPVTSDIPSLILVGELDPVTPPNYAKIISNNLSQYFLFEFPYKGHGLTRDTDCAKNIAHEFLQNPYVVPDNACIEEIENQSIQWVTKYYSNSNIAPLFNKILYQKKWDHITGVILLILSFLVATILMIITFCGRKKNPVNSRLKKRDIITGLATFIAVLFLSGLSWFASKTDDENGLLILMGLVDDAIPFMYISFVVIALALLSWFLYFRSYKYATTGGNVIYGIMNLSLLWVCVLIFQYQLFPG